MHFRSGYLFYKGRENAPQSLSLPFFLGFHSCIEQLFIEHPLAVSTVIRAGEIRNPISYKIENLILDTSTQTV